MKPTVGFAREALPSVREAVGRSTFSLVAPSLGLLATTLSFAASRREESWAMVLFWAGILLICIPPAARLLQPATSRNETAWTVVGIGGLLFLVSILREPLAIRSFDEFLHWRTADDILRTGALFTSNSMLLVSPLFPGLEIVTTALANLTGLSLTAAGILVVGVARLVALLSLFLVFEGLTDSHRAAGLGAITYMGSSTFVFFNTQYAYESLGAPLGMLVTYLLSMRSRTVMQERRAWTSTALLGLLALVVVHHVSAYMLAIFMGIWTVITMVMKGRGGPPMWRLTLLFFVTNGLWLLLVAGPTIQYLAPNIMDSVISAQQLLTNRRGAGQLLSMPAEGGINYERLVGIASVGIVMIVLLPSLWCWWRCRSRSALSLALALGAAAYPAIPAMRMNESTWEVSNRLSGFLFVGVAFVVGLWLSSLRLRKMRRDPRYWLILSSLAVLIIGGIIAGSNPVTRLPGPYIVGADARSVDVEGIAAAEWAGRKLGTDNRMAGDRIQSILMGSYGRQRMVSRPSDGVNISGIFLSRELGTAERKIIKGAQIRYLVVDRRVSRSLPLYGHYFEKWEQMVEPYVPPAPASSLDKFSLMTDVSCVLDGGAIRVYDVGAVSIDH